MVLLPRVKITTEKFLRLNVEAWCREAGCWAGFQVKCSEFGNGVLEN